MTRTSKPSLPFEAVATLDALLARAEMHRDALDQIEQAVLDITGELDDAGNPATLCQNTLAQEAVRDGALDAKNILAGLGVAIREKAA